MSAVLTPGRAAALPDRSQSTGSSASEAVTEATAIGANLAWEVDRALMLERSERRAWWVAIAGLVLGLIGIAGITAHLCLTTALTLAPASTVMPIDFARLPLIAVVGAVFYDEPVELALFLGAGLIFLGIWITLRTPSARP